MTGEQAVLIEELMKCSFIPGTWDKRFVKSLGRKTHMDELSVDQIKWLNILAWKYRKQISVIVQKPDDYPDKRKASPAYCQEDQDKLQRWIKAAKP
jgi:hypothetical protein